MPPCRDSVPWPWLLPAALIFAVERDPAGAVHGPLVVDASGFQAGQRDERLEGRTRRLLRLNRLVQQRMVGIVGNLLPVLGLDPDRELVRVEGRPADHRQHLAGPRIERHHGAVLRPVSWAQFGHHLQVQVDRELQVLPGNRRLGPEHLPHLPAIVHHHLALPVHARQRCRCTAFRCRTCRRRRPGCTWRTPAASSSCSLISPVYPMTCASSAVLRIQPPLRLDQHQLREEIVMRIHERQVGRESVRA